MTMSEVSRKGTLILSFNLAMDFSSFDNKTYAEIKTFKK